MRLKQRLVSSTKYYNEYSLLDTYSEDIVTFIKI